MNVTDVTDNHATISSVTDKRVARSEYERRRRREKREAWPLMSCAKCGESFKPTRSDARFCSDRCRQRAHRDVKEKPPHEAGAEVG
jgi:hypothetical protein